jgi:pseudouridine synthase
LAAGRLQKVIAASGLTSRRRAEQWITAGRVTVDGKRVTELGVQVDPDAVEVRVDGEPLPRPDLVVIALHKPTGVVTSVSDPFADRVVVDLLGPDVSERVYPAGRLDQDSEGLVLLTNDGALMQAMTSPGGPVAKVYEVTVRGRPPADALDGLRRGMQLAGRRLLPCEIEPLEVVPDGEVFRVVLHEGKKNQIRRMFRSISHPVIRLVRTRVGPVRLGDLEAGAYRILGKPEVDELRVAAGLAEESP